MVLYYILCMARIALHPPLAWLDQGLRILETQGRDALTLENLAQGLGATKGSFYHHFKNLADFRTQLMAHFEYESTFKVIKQGENIADPKAKPATVLDEIVMQAAHNWPRAESVLRAWSLEDSEVRATIRAIDNARIEYGTRLFYRLTGSRTRAKAMIKVLYALLLGSEQLEWDNPGAYYTTVFNEFKKLYHI